MSADWQVQAAESWQLTLPCTKAEAARIADDADTLAGIDPPPTLMTSEPDPDRPEAWQLDAYFEGQPDDATVARVRTLVPSAAGVQANLRKLDDADWVTLSQADLAPIRAGRFFVHTAAHADAAPAGSTAFHIEAGRAFGTGHHETTTGCLLLIDRMRARGQRFRDIVDVGTGTGLLAFAARACWPQARVIASDIDPVSIQVTAANARANGVPTGRGRDAIELVTAAGLAHPRLLARAPYDLVIANILASPLVELAPVLSSALRPGGSLLLAGLLDTQADAVAAAYRAQGLRLAERLDNGHWPTLRMVRRLSARRVGRAPLPRARLGGDWSADGSMT